MYNKIQIAFGLKETFDDKVKNWKIKIIFL